jgi:hypothetical protein
MAAVQMMCARIGKVTGQGLAGNFKQRFPRWLLNVFIVALLVANTINIASDLAGMADAAEMLSGVKSQVFVVSLCLVSLHLVPEMPLPCRGGLDFVSAGYRSYCTINVREVDPALLPELACTITV